jgi:hypothetical protein
MSNKSSIVVFLAVLALGTLVIGAAAFTTATLQRDTTIDVVADDNGIIALGDGDSGGLVDVRSNGELTIDFTRGGAISGGGANVESIYELGDPDNQPTGEYAFNITNRDTVSHEIALNYTVDNGNGQGDGYNNTEFEVFDGGTSELVVSEEDDTSGNTITLNSGETNNITVTVDTRANDTSSTVDNTSDLSGTLNITATTP